MRGARLWNVRVRAVDPLFTRERHPLDAEPLDFLSAQDARNRHPDHAVFSRSPQHEHAVLAVEPARKVARSEPLFSAHVQHLPYESAFGAAVAIVVHEVRLVRLLIPCCQSCTCNKKRWGNSFTFCVSLFFI